MDLIIVSDFDCVLAFGGSYMQIKGGWETTLQINNESTLICVYPSKSSILSEYSFLLNNNIETFNDDNFFAKIYKINNSHYLLRLYKKYCVQAFATLDRISTIFNDYEVLQDENLIITSGGEKLFTRNIICNSANISTSNNLIFFELLYGKKNHLIVINQNNQILLEDEISSLEHTADGFQTLTKFCDIQKQGVVKKYKLTNESIEKSDEYAVYLKKSAQPLFNPELAKICFFEGVRVGNISLCKQFLSDELAFKLGPTHLQQYFGEFDEIFDFSSMLGRNTITTINSKNGTIKTFRLTINNNLIENISAL